MEGPWDQYATAEAGPWDQYKAAPSDNAKPQIGIGEDLGNAAKAAPGRAVASLLGLPGDLYHLGLRALGDNLTPRSDYGSEAIRQSLGSDYQAQRLPGQLLEKTADFAPAMIGGPESLALKAATRVAAPVIGSQVGKEVAGPYGEVAGALLGAGGASAAARKFQEMAAARSSASAVMPSGEELLKTGSNQFNEARNMDLMVKSDFAKRTAQDMRASVENYDPEQIKPVLSAIDRVATLYQPEKRNLYNALNVDRAAAAVPMNEVELARKQLSSLRTSPDASIRTAAKSAQEAITKNQMALVAGDAISGDAPLYAKTMREAVGNYGAGKRSAVITGKQSLGELNAGTAGSGGNDDNALRQALKQLARPINNTNVPVAKKLGFNDVETAAIRQGAMGTPIGNTARYLGKLAPTGSVSGALGAGAGYGVGGPVGAIALPAAGYLAKKIGDMSTKSAVKTLDALVRSRSPLAQQVVAQLPPQVVAQLPPRTQRILQTLAITAPAVRQQMGQPIGQPAAQ